MDFELIIISVILVASVFVPFFIIDFSGKSGIKQMKKSFKLELSKQQLKTTEQENWGNTFIGVDGESMKMLFMKFTEVEPVTLIIDLKKVYACEIESKVATIKTKIKKESILQKLNLKIRIAGTENSELILNFYDVDGIYGEDFEFARAEKWSAIINRYKQTNIPGKKAA